MNHIQLLDYMNLLEFYSLKTATINFEGKYRSDFSATDDFLSEIISDSEFQSFIENQLLSIHEITEIYGEDEQIISLFKECFVKIFVALNVKLNSFYNNSGDYVTKRNLVGLGLLFCRGHNISKLKLFFDLFKDENGNFCKSEKLDNYLIGIFFISSYCMVSLRTRLNSEIHNLPKIDNNLAANLLNNYGLAQKNCENLLKYFNEKFFDKESLTWEEFKKKFKNNSFSWIFSTKGIRSKLENIKIN